MMYPSPNDLFQFVRGALRGAFGTEDLNGRRVLIIGMDLPGQQLLTMLCVDGIRLFFEEESLVNYNNACMVCPQVRPYAGQKVDLIIDLDEGFVVIGDKFFAISFIGEEPYTQGIHFYYQ